MIAEDIFKNGQGKELVCALCGLITVGLTDESDIFETYVS